MVSVVPMSASCSRFRWRSVSILWLLLCTVIDSWWLPVDTITLCGARRWYDRRRCRGLCLLHSKDQPNTDTQLSTFPFQNYVSWKGGKKFESTFDSVGQPKYISILDVPKHKTEDIPRSISSFEGPVLNCNCRGSTNHPCWLLTWINHWWNSEQFIQFSKIFFRML